jgi:spore maturation protein CgeB
LRADQVPLFEVYFSFTGGPALRELETRWHARRAETLYCGVDPRLYQPVADDTRFACSLGYMGTYAADRQARVESMFIGTARARPDERFVLAGPQYPPMDLPPNVRHEVHLYPRDHAAFYSSNTATLNLTRAAMRRYGWSPASRLFEAAACGACIISDTWPGLERVLEPGQEVLLADSPADVAAHLEALTPLRRAAIGRAARARVLREHTFARRAEQVDAAISRSLAAVGAS